MGVGNQIELVEGVSRHSLNLKDVENVSLFSLANTPHGLADDGSEEKPQDSRLL